MILIACLLVIVPLVFNLLANRRADRLTAYLKRESVKRVRGGRVYDYQRYNVVRYEIRQGGLVYSI